MEAPVRLCDLVTDDASKMLARHCNVEVNDIYLVKPSINDFMALTNVPGALANPEQVLKAIVRTRNRKAIIKAEKLESGDPDLYLEIFNHALKFFRDYAREQDEIALEVLGPGDEPQTAPRPEPQAEPTS